MTLPVQENVGLQVKDAALLVVLNATGTAIVDTSSGTAAVEHILPGAVSIWDVGRAVWEAFDGHRAAGLPRRQAERVFRAVFMGRLK